MAGAFVAGAIVSSLILDTKKWSSSVSKVNSDQAKMAGMSEKTAAKFRKVGAAMTIVGAAILAGMGKAVQAFGDFDQAMTESTSIMGDMSEEMRDQMEETALQMSGESVFAAKDLGEAYFFLASAGLDAEESIGALPLVTAFATAGAFDLSTATDLLTDAQSALGLTVDDTAQSQENMIRVSDVLVKANTLANASVMQFSEALTNKAGAAMRAYGIEVESGVAVLAAFADQGTKGRDAGTQFSIVLRELQKAALQNKKAFKAAGIAVYDANGNFNNMGDIVAQLEERLDPMSAEMKKAEMSTLGFSEKSQMALLTLMGTSDKIKEYEKALRSAGGITDEVAQKQLLGFNNQMTMAKNKVMAAAISIGEQLAPTVVSLATTISNVVSKITDWARANPALFSTVTKVVAGLGAMMAILGPMVMILPRLISNIRLMKTAIQGMSGKLGLVGAIATAAFVGWKIGKRIGEMKILGATINEHVIARFDKLIEVTGLWKSTAKAGEGHTAALEKRQRMLAEATEIAGEEITSIQDALAILNGTMTKAERHAQALATAEKEVKDKGDEEDATLVKLKTTIALLEGPTDNFVMQQYQLAHAFSDGEIGIGQYVKRMADLREERKRNLALFDEEQFQMDESLEGIEQYVAEWESVPPALDSVFAQIGLASFETDTEIEKHAKETAEETVNIWAEATDGMVTEWSQMFGDFVASGDIFKGDFSGLMDGIFNVFTDSVGQIIASYAQDFIGGILSKGPDLIGGITSMFGSAASGATGAMGGATSSILGNFATMAGPLGIGLMAVQLIGFENISKTVTDVWNAVSENVIANFKAVGEFGRKILGGLGDMLGGIMSGIGGVAAGLGSLGQKKSMLGTKDQWHLEHIYINTKELRDYTFMNIGGSGGWLAKIHDKMNAVVLKNEFQMKQNRKMINLMKDVNREARKTSKNTAPLAGLLKDISKSIKSIPRAQRGYTATQPELVMMHGTPAKPEHAIPDDRLRSLLAAADRGGGGGGGDVNLEQNVNFNGLMISDRDYMRTRGIPEMLEALKANVGLADLKEIIGVT